MPARRFRIGIVVVMGALLLGVSASKASEVGPAELMSCAKLSMGVTLEGRRRLSWTVNGVLLEQEWAIPR